MLIGDRHIAHYDMEQFFVSIERLRNAKLNGKPVLIGGSNDRGIVAACSTEAMQYGIQVGMPMRIAQRLCRHSMVVRADYEEYARQSSLICDIIKDQVPLVEKSNIDEFYVDLTGMDKFFGCKKFVQELKRKVQQHSGLSSSSGLASNKLVSRVAAREIKPNGQLEIPFGKEKTFLAPLSVIKLPGVGKETAFKLLKMGVETVKVLSEIPPEFLCEVLGKGGNELARRANGIDDSPVIPYVEQKYISAEHTLQEDTISMQILNSELLRMTEALAFQLRSQQKVTGCVIVKLRYTDHETHECKKSIPFTNLDEPLISCVREVFSKLFTRRVLVRMIGIRYTNLIPGTYQIDLFQDKEEKIKLYQSIDHIKKRFGEDLLKRATGI